ncbi:MAG: glycerophosphodiester phosphodiesterase [Planctomycetes bacterium]|nr:glycerophosphodiester phosphodiesterase [Planctomycetota bacterium]
MSAPLPERLSARLAIGTLCCAHRGASHTAPENTCAAFRLAVELGAELVELDVRTSADGVPVALHDATLDRTTDALARLERSAVDVAELTVATMRTLDAGRWKGPGFAGERVPTLADALAAILPVATPFIEVKRCAPATLLALLRERGAVEHVVVQSFDWALLGALRALEPRLPIAALGSGALGPAQLDEATSLGAALLHWECDGLRLCDVDRARERGLLVGCYTVDAELPLLGCLTAGIDVVTTNVPDRLLALRSRAGARGGVPD